MFFRATGEGFGAHPYDVPCVLRCAIAEGHQPYLDLMSESVLATSSEYQKPE